MATKHTEKKKEMAKRMRGGDYRGESWDKTILRHNKKIGAPDAFWPKKHEPMESPRKRAKQASTRGLVEKGGQASYKPRHGQEGTGGNIE